MRARATLKLTAEIAGAVALASVGVALLEPSAPVSGLEVLYLLAVLTIAVRHGERPALVTAVAGVLTVNYLFITPRHQFGIAHSQDLVELAVLMIAALVVGRLAATARQRAAEAESRARLAAARGREATLLAEVASEILAGRNVAAQLDGIGRRIARGTGAKRARVTLESVPAPEPGETVQPLRTRERTAWLFLSADASISREDLERLSDPLGRLIDVAIERERVGEQAAEAEAARRAEAARTAILHAISHDLRTPLTAITTAGSALRAQVSPAERAELLDVIGQEGSRLAKLVADLLDLSKIQAGALDPQTDWCDLPDVVATAAGSLRSSHPIEFALPPDLPLVRADAAQLERVFSNLIENAVKFSPAGIAVRITAGTAAGRVTVRVIDRGSGIPAADRPHVFEPFFRGRQRASGSGSGSSSGSGLGLAICQGFVHANGGQIVLASGGGRGTSFAVTFPAAQAPDAAPGPQAGSPEVAGRR